MRQMETGSYLSALRELAEAGHALSVPVAGGSMAPFLINGRDTVYFEAPRTPLRPGDMVFYQRRDGRFVMHRIYRVRREGYYLLGDAQTVVEGPLDREQIFARVTAVKRKGKRAGPGSFWWRFFAGPWRWLRPLRPALLRGYSYVGRLLGHGR